MLPVSLFTLSHRNTSPAAHSATTPSRIDWSDDVARATGGFLLLAATTKMATAAGMADVYARWGLVGGIRLLIGLAEIAIVALLMGRRTRRTGLSAGIAASMAMSGLLVWDGDYGIAVFPAVLAAVLVPAGLRVGCLQVTGRRLMGVPPTRLMAIAQRERSIVASMIDDSTISIAPHELCFTSILVEGLFDPRADDPSSSVQSMTGFAGLQ